MHVVNYSYPTLQNEDKYSYRIIDTDNKIIEQQYKHRNETLTYEFSFPSP